MHSLLGLNDCCSIHILVLLIVKSRIRIYSSRLDLQLLDLKKALKKGSRMVKM